MMAVVTITKNDKVEVVDDTECIRDYPFEWTEEWNQFFVDNTFWKDFMIVKSSVGIDFMLISYLVVYFFWGTTTRIPSGLVFFYPTRNVL